MDSWYEVERKSGGDFYGNRFWQTWPNESPVESDVFVINEIRNGRVFKHEAAAEAVCAMLEAEEYQRPCRVVRVFEDGRREPVND